MKYMFEGAKAFNQPLGDWDISSVTDMEFMFYGVTLSTANYDHLLLGWSQLSLQQNVHFDAGNSKYSSGGTAARQLFIDTYHWVITDGDMVLDNTTTSPLPASFIAGYSASFLTGILLVMVILFSLRKRKRVL